MKGITFGVFDGLHQGHLNILEKAGKKCKLIVGVSSDEYVRDVKGVKTMFNYNHRAKLVSSLKFVWKVVKQEQGSKEKLVKKHKPDVIFVGTDWRGKDWDGAKLGIPVKYIKHTEGISSTQMRLSVDTEKMKTDTTFIIKTFKRYNCLEFTSFFKDILSRKQDFNS
jgi:glycerol-3-phosphate cytidylyltransferase